MFRLKNWMSLFLNMYHGVSPEGAGATTVAWFWGLMSIGCLLGLVIVKLIDSKLMLRIFSMIAILNLAIALYASSDYRFRLLRLLDLDHVFGDIRLSP